MYTIEIDAKKYTAIVSVEDWPHGISVLVKVVENETICFKSKVLCSASSPIYQDIAELSSEALKENAWQYFNENYPFDKLDETLESGITFLLGWQ